MVDIAESANLLVSSPTPQKTKTCIVVATEAAKAALLRLVREDVRVFMVGDGLTGNQFDEILVIGREDVAEMINKSLAARQWFEVELQQRLKINGRVRFV